MPWRPLLDTACLGALSWGLKRPLLPFAAPVSASPSPPSPPHGCGRPDDRPAPRVYHAPPTPPPASDVAQRGLDIKDVGAVINFDAPSSGEAYVHRIGRTGRAGSKGSAISLLTPEDARFAAELMKVLKGVRQPVPDELEQLAAHAPRRRA